MNTVRTSEVPFLVFERLSKRFGELEVLKEISLVVDEGETVVLLGPSGSGKTTLLRAIAGFERPDRGVLRLLGEEITDVPPERRNFGMVFQHYALFPHLSVAENVAYGLAARGVAREQRAARVDEVLELVDLAGFGLRRVDQISGGQQQRVALARALAPQPQVLLLDEPLSNLDPGLRERTRGELKEAVQRVGTTAVWVTHEQEEAFDVGDRIAVLNDGRLEQVGAPEELYSRPQTAFVAGFVGRVSAVRGRWHERTVALEVGGGDPVRWRAEAVGEIGEGDAVELVARPEMLEISLRAEATGPSGEVTDKRYRGALTLYRVELGDRSALEVQGGLDTAEVGEHVYVQPRPDAGLPWAFPSPSEVRKPSA